LGEGGGAARGRAGLWARCSGAQLATSI